MTRIGEPEPRPGLRAADRVGTRALVLFAFGIGVLAAAVGLTWQHVKAAREVAADARARAVGDTERTAQAIDGLLRQVMPLAGDAAQSLGRSGQSDAQIVARLTELARTNRAVRGMGAAYAPFAFSKERQLFAPYVLNASPGVTRRVRVLDMTETEQFLRTYEQRSSSRRLDRIRTGAFVKSIEFLSSTNVQVTGQVWQRFPAPAPRVAAFALADADKPDILEVSRHREGAEEVVLWSFPATIRDNFSYEKYPFDRQNVSVRLKPSTLGRAEVLVPDFPAYTVSNPAARPGLASDLGSKDERLSQFAGFTAKDIIKGAAAFFVISFQHIALRNALASPRLIYFEYFYFTTYLGLLGVVLNGILFATGAGGQVVEFRDNLLPKIAFWPTLMTGLFIVTLVVFY